MFLRIVYVNGKYDMVKDFVLDSLITSGKVKGFLRADGWAMTDRDPIRGRGGIYAGPERRTSKKIESPTLQ
jgi:hypothetical protein